MTPQQRGADLADPAAFPGGLLDRLRAAGGAPAVHTAGGGRISGIAFAATAEHAAAGLRRRGARSGDTAAVLCRPGADRLLASLSVLAAGGTALPLHTAAAPADYAALLCAYDTRVLITDAAGARTALALAERSRVRQVLAFSGAPGTTPFDDLLLPGAPDPAAPAPPGALLSVAADGSLATRSGAQLAQRCAEFGRRLAPGPADLVAVDPRLPDADALALTAAALGAGASVAVPGADQGSATVQGAPPTRSAAG
ncbi:AMP-binding protein [Nocardiopsis coralliicola]